ncbi:MAG: hypothetical protein ACYDBB_21730 [Armatimonadota bacterium]
MNTEVTPEQITTSYDETLPFALLRFPATQSPAEGTCVARREAGAVLGSGTLTIAGGHASFTGGPGETEMHRCVLPRALGWLGHDVDGSYPLTWRVEHRALVEADGAGITLGEFPPNGMAGSDALALAWVAALVAAKTGNPRLALRRVAAIYRELTAEEQACVQAALTDGAYDAGNLCAIFLARSAQETSADEMERWESWFLGQRALDLPYNRKAVIDILASDVDPDQKRLQIHDTVRRFDWEMERLNITRLVAEVRANNQELVFGRMSRAFHNQGLLFANAGYVQVNDGLRRHAAELTALCAGSALLAPPADRLRMLIHGAQEIALTEALGAVELLEDAVLDDQRKGIEAQLQKDREGLAGADVHSALLARADALLNGCRALRVALQTAQRRPAAYVILSQRLSATGSHLFARINEFQEPYLGKAENLKMLVRKGAHRMYASPEYAWLHHADHWVEAIPLFIKERVLVVDGAEVTETVIDQATMEESFREQLADHWAMNIDNVMDSEHVALAREILARTDTRLTGDDKARATAVAAHGLVEEVGALAATIADAYRANAEQVHLYAEKEGCSRYEALRACLPSPLPRPKAGEGEASRLAQIAHLPRRPLPVLHVLTTQSARMSDGYIRTWLEESMALYNVVRANGLEKNVKERMAGYRTLIADLGARLVRELGMWPEVEEVMALEKLSEARAVSRIVAGNAAIARQVSILAVLGEHLGLQPGEETTLVDEILAAQGEALQQQALSAVYERNDLDLLPLVDGYRTEHPDAEEADAIRALIMDNPDYEDDLAVFTRFAAREATIKELDRRDPALCLGARAKEWLRNHSRLALTTARRETLLAHNFNGLTLHPLYYYRAAGGNKRFHQLYTPSRVDLGSRERESVETWAQWVGGADREAARVGRRIYGLINKRVKMFDSLTEPEVLKTGENASMVANFAYANAMSLLVNAVGCGDVEDLGDQMSLRKDRIILPGGEGYGGYCVPKDGLFLEFVLVLTRATKLRQLGVPDHLHAGVVALGHTLLARRDEFASELEWEAWAAELIANRDELSAYFSLRPGEDGPVPVFQITRIAQALTRLGRPELTNSFDVLANLTARWGIHKIIVGGEHVNRFMPFYKAWLTYRAVEEGRTAGIPAGKFSPKENFTVVLSAEYKPDTQDGRFSVGMRKYEIFAGTAEHLTYSLDVPGQDLVHLMFQGFDHLWQNQQDPRLNARLTRLLHEMEIRPDDESAISKLREMFPGYAPPAEIRMVSPMGLATTDLLHYTSDTSLEANAQEAQRRLLNAGLTDSEISANMQVYGPHIERWTKLRELPAAQLSALQARLGGGIHALALTILGPAGNYEIAVQGADVLDTGVPHKELLALLADPVKVRELMLEGNPNSALVIVDGAAGARRRAMNRLAVMRWFAAGEAIGRTSIYRCIGLGAETIDGWRAEMRDQRARARGLYEALVSGDLADARSRYADLVRDVQEGQEASLALESEERLLRFNKLTAQEAAVNRALADVASGLLLEELDFGTWLALGGQFWLMGAIPARMEEVRRNFEEAIPGSDCRHPAGLGVSAAHSDLPAGMPALRPDVLFCPAYLPAAQEFSEEKGIESSNKATEEVVAVAIDTRKHLMERAARAKALYDREAAFRAVIDAYAEQEPALDDLLANAFESRGDGTALTQIQFGQLQAYTRLALIELAREVFADDIIALENLRANVEALFIGRGLDPLAIRPIAGGYEDPGDIARLGTRVIEMFREETISEAERDRLVEQVACVAELFDCCKAVDLTLDFFTVAAEPAQVWRALADFFAESLNDHFYSYRPWVYSRGIGFSHIKDEELYALSVEHHRWLDRYLRMVALTQTELQELPAEGIAELLGDLTTAGTHPAIGAGAETAAERRWRAYCQLREVAFIRNDGFPLPDVFPAFDPAIIRADERVNMLFMYPVGRTHVSRALLEGPALAAEMNPGVNLLIGRDASPTEFSNGRQVLQAEDAHLVISREEYVQALMQHRGLTAEAAEACAAERVGPKGVRIAARFTRPITCAVVFPFHRHPKYDSGLLEELGLPYSSQSRFHTWTTYDKAKYPAIFAPETGVDIPGEMDWLCADTLALGEEDTRRVLEFGDPARNFPGFRTFAETHRLVMVKDAAESGGRGQKAFLLRGTDDAVDEAVLREAVDFAYAITLKHNVAIQEVIIASPEYWATEEFLQSFVDRQVQEWGAPVNRTRRPRTSIYGSQRIIFSSDNPAAGNWHLSHPITLNSRQLITNVGRGGTLEILRPEFIRPEYRDALLTRLRESGEKTMNALARYGALTADRYREETGNEIGQDATGLSYAVPRYMMLDFLVQPIFHEAGTLVDLEPVYDATGERTGSRFILQQGDNRIEGTVKDWRVVLIEPNIGIGLWDRVALREETYAGTADGDMDWTQVGANARIVLRDFAKAGRDYLAAIKE